MATDQMMAQDSTNALPKLMLPSCVDVDQSDWGPRFESDTLSFCLGNMDIYPLEINSRIDRIGRVCDFTYFSAQRAQLRDGRAAINALEEEAEFRLVDSRPLKLNRYQGRRKQQPRRTQQQQQQQQQQQHHHHQQQMPSQQQNRQQMMNNRHFQQQQLQRQQWMKQNRMRQLAEWSVEPQPSWDLIETLQLTVFPKLALDGSKIAFKDVQRFGELRYYKKAFDRILPKHKLVLNDQFIQQKSFYWPSTSEDSFLIEQFEKDPSITVAATDQILACLMSAAQSRLSWHLIFHKFNNRIVMDKHTGTSIDLMTVNETSKEPPLPDHPVKHNRPIELSAEALKINQNLSQQVLDFKSGVAEHYDPPPFADGKDTPASKMYRYRLITLPPATATWTQDQKSFAKEPVTLLVRTEVDAILPNTDDQYCAIRAVNEYSSIARQSWTHQLETHHGALIVQESKNNHCKVAKWTSQAMIGGCEHIKIGFVTRSNPSQNNKHLILDVQSYRVKDLGIQIGMQLDNIWGIVRNIIDLLMLQPNGHYTLVKDPLKSELKLYLSEPADEPPEPIPAESLEQKEAQPQ